MNKPAGQAQKRAVDYYTRQFIDTFMRDNKKAQWEVLLSDKISEEIASELSTWDFWDNESVKAKYCTNASIAELKALTGIQSRMDSIVLLITLGHDDFCMSFCLLSQILNHEIYVLEGVVIIQPAKLALVFNHDGEIKLCQKDEY